MKFTAETRDTICPYQIRNDILSNSGTNPLSITASGISNFIIKARNKMQSDYIKTITSINNTNCNTEVHTQLNNTKGLIYISEYDLNDIEGFAEGLKEKYKNITEVKHAEFIKTRNEAAKPLLITFNQTTIPPYLDIPGEPSKTKVIPFKHKPMRCVNCQKYGHTDKRCNNRERTCSICAQEGHQKTECTTNTKACIYCPDAHSTGDNKCPREIKEKLIIDTQDKYKVGRRAVQLISGKSMDNNLTGTLSKQFPTHFLLKLLNRNEPNNDNAQQQSHYQKKSINPFTIEKTIENFTGKKTDQNYWPAIKLYNRT